MSFTLATSGLLNPCPHGRPKRIDCHLCQAEMYQRANEREIDKQNARTPADYVVRHIGTERRKAA